MATKNFNVSLSPFMVYNQCMKTCSTCKIEKPYEDFAKDSRKKLGLKSRCKSCNSKAALDYYYKNHEESKRKGREKNLNPQHRLIRLKWLIESYGITWEEYENLLIKQNEVCAICEKPCSVNSRLSVDHSNNGVRGLLCFSCNVAIGKLNHDPSLLRKAASYLEENEYHFCRDKQQQN